jgi:uncharacterized membrane protein
MKSQLTHRWALPPTWLRFLVIVLLALGIYFRFVNLDRKVYWHDETITSLTVAGYTAEGDLKQQLFNGDVIGVEDLHKYQYPTAKKSFLDTLNVLITKDPQHPPTYYMMVRLGMHWFNNPVVVSRGVAALISLLVFPCIYWLCLELFGSSLIGWVAIALMTVSPVHVVFAQEAREYSLWMVAILLSSALLLRAMRLQTKVSWVTYAVSLAFGLYSFPLVGLTAIGHFIYVATIARFRWSKTVAAYLLATLVGILAFAPWIWVILNGLSQARSSTSWSSTQVSLLRLVKSWAGNISRVFFDINLDAKAPAIYTIPSVLILLTLAGYAVYFICREAPKQVSLFILILIGVPALTFILPDLIVGGMRSTVPRYLIPCYLGILLMVAYLIGNQIVSSHLFQQKFWQFIATLLISAGIVSCIVSSNSQVWWNKSPSNINVQIAKMINQTERPLLVSTFYESNGGELLSLSYLLDKKVQLQLVSEPNIPKIPQGFSDIFIFSPSQNLKFGIEKDYNSSLEPIQLSEPWLWKLKK